MRVVRVWKAARHRSVHCRPSGRALSLRAAIRASIRPRASRTSRRTTTTTSSAPTRPTPRENAGTFTPRPWTIAVEGEARSGRARIDIDDLLKRAAARGARLPHALRRSLVDGHSLARLPARGAGAPRRADLARQVRRVHHAARPGADAGTAPRRASTGPTSRGCASTRRRTRSRCSPPASTARRCPTRTARRCGWSCPGSTASRASSRSSRSASREQQPQTTWNDAAPDEYGFYANVNPEVDHPRWSQATERRIGEFERRITLRSTATAKRWRALYAGWTCGGTSD